MTNNIIVKLQVKTTDGGDKIEAAFKRSAEVDARRIMYHRMEMEPANSH